MDPKIPIRDNWKCRFCGSRNGLHIHHIKYRSQGGDNSDDNLVTLCWKCHDAHHRGSLEIKWDDEYKSVVFRRIKRWNS